MQLKPELHNVKRENLNNNDYSMEIKKLANSLAAVVVLVEDIDLVSMTLNNPSKEYHQFVTSIGV